MTQVNRRHRPRALVYGDVNLNIIDGSAIWAVSIVEALAGAGAEVTFVLKARVRTERLLEPLRRLPSVRIVAALDEGLATARGDTMSPATAISVLRTLDAEQRHDLVVMRGLRAVSAAVESTSFNGRLWAYLTDIPQHPSAIDPAMTEQLAQIAQASRVLLCQTSELRSLLEFAVPGAAGRCLLWPPVVPPADAAPSAPDGSAPVQSALADPQPNPSDRPLQLVYSGKFAPLWNTLAMTALPGLCSRAGINVTVHMIGDKIHDDPADATFATRMRTALTDTPGVHWHGGLPRAEALALMATMDVSLSWRDPLLDDSLEISTKVLEAGTLGLPIVLNRTLMHEDLLGPEYPLFLDTPGEVDEVVACLGRLALEPTLRQRAGVIAERATAEFTMAAAVARMRGYLALCTPEVPQPSRAQPLRVLIASHDLKFFTRALDHYRSLPGVVVRLDHWSTLTRHDPEQSRRLNDWADVVIAEWAGPNAVWYSRHRRPGQRLIVRLHRFELGARWLDDIDAGAVDQCICVNAHYAELTAQRTGWDRSRIVVVPNIVDLVQFNRPKHAGADLRLGLIGAAPARKGLHRALDVLTEVRRIDPRYRLLIKSRLPWELWWVWKRPEERAYFEEAFERIRQSAELADAVTFDPYGADVADWLRRVGWVLSTSDDESFHLAPAEGMASGALPVVWDWPGARTVYDDAWVHGDVASMAAAIAGAPRVADDPRIPLVRQQVAAFDAPVVLQSLTEVLTENLPRRW
ncbi:MAG: glycosyltransferase [Actinomycetales bacterium]|nr:glycosyltransferase [Actinomycetales bacterium]